jgi:GH15 family glucan-1,4-alpha-glucosidase
MRDAARFVPPLCGSVPRAGLGALALAALGAALVPACGGGSGGASSPRPLAPAPYQARASQSNLPLSNGFAAASYSLATHKVDAFRDHIYAKRSPSETTRDWCHDAYFGWRKGAASQWLDQTLESSAAYLEGTGILKVEQRVAGLRFETYWFAPMTGGAEAGMVGLIRAVNEGPAASDCALFFLANMKLGGEGDAASEWAFYADASAPDGAGPYLMEGKEQTGNRFIYKPIGAAPTTASFAPGGPTSPHARVVAGEHLVASSGPLNADDIACGLEWRINGGGTFGSGAEAWAGVFVAFGSDGDEAALKAKAKTFAGALAPEDVITRERASWDAFHAVETLPASLSADERALLRQSTAVLRMAQCREPGAPEGQILASLPPGQWNICWPRDAAYSIVALARTGHHAEAKKGLEFMLKGTADQFRPYVGAKYRISVCRYFGNGREESDDNGNGPNIELDDFGLFLWAFAETVERSNDAAFLSTWFPLVRDEVADVLVSLVDGNGLLKADSSIWERHWTAAPNTPDGRKQFAYSSINAANGLARAAALATRAGDAAKAAAWQAAAQGITDAVRRELLLPNGAIAASIEEKALGERHAADASVIEAVNHGLAAPSSELAAKTYAYLERELRAWPLRSPGYLRVDDARHYGPNNEYDRQEWVVIDLRVASALVRMGRRAEAKALLDWVTAQSKLNANLVAELYDEVSSGYAGAVPMAGFGAGAYVLASLDWHAGTGR